MNLTRILAPLLKLREILGILAQKMAEKWIYFQKLPKNQLFFALFFVMDFEESLKIASLRAFEGR